MFYIYIKRRIDNDEIGIFEKVPITKIIESIEIHGFKFLLHKANKPDFKKFLVTESKTGMALCLANSEYEIRTKLKEVKSYSKTEMLLSIGKGMRLLSELENKFK